MIYPSNIFVTKDGENIYWVAKSSCLKGCIGQGKDVYDAVKELEGNEKLWLETAKELGVEIPEVPVNVLSE